MIRGKRAVPYTKARTGRLLSAATSSITWYSSVGALRTASMLESSARSVLRSIVCTRKPDERWISRLSVVPIRPATFPELYRDRENRGRHAERGPTERMDRPRLCLPTTASRVRITRRRGGQSLPARMMVSWSSMAGGLTPSGADVEGTGSSDGASPSCGCPAHPRQLRPFHWHCTRANLHDGSTRPPTRTHSPARSIRNCGEIKDNVEPEGSLQVAIRN